MIQGGQQLVVNGLHSLEVSLDLERGQQHHSVGVKTGFVCMLSLFNTGSYPTSLQRLGFTLC